MAHEESAYAEGTKLDALISILFSLIAVSIIATVVILTNNANTPPSWTGY